MDGVATLGTTFTVSVRLQCVTASLALFYCDYSSLFSKITDKLSINGELKSVSDLTGVKSDGSGIVPLKDYNLLNGKVSYLLNENSNIYLNGENLLDETYETSSGYGTAKRSFYLGYETKF